MAAGHVRILLGTYNGAAWLGAQLQSYLAQTHPDWTLWISDDGSTDGTRDIIEAFARANPGRVARVLEGPGRGSAANFLSLLCHPDLPVDGLTALSDQDDVWLPGKLARAADVLDAAPGAPPQGWAARFFVTDEALGRRRVSQLWPRGPSFGNALVQNVMSGHTTTLNPAALALIRRAGRQPVPHHDWWIYQLLAGAGAEIHLDPAPQLLYRQHAENHYGARWGLRAFTARYVLMRDRKAQGWVAANVAALEACAPLLTAEARACLAGYRALEGVRGRARVAAFRRLGLTRQSRLGTRMLHVAAQMGHI